jgi:hypothetical protein
MTVGADAGKGAPQSLFRTGGRLIPHARYFTLQLAESSPKAP